MTAFWKLFWLAASIGGVAWYIGITWYVAWKGTYDIKHMLKTLRDRDSAAKGNSPQ